LSQVGGIFVNLISNMLGNMIKTKKERDAIKKFGQELQDWAEQFKISDENDNTVLTTGAFADCESWVNPLKEIVNYVFAPSNDALAEKDFLNKLYNMLVSGVQTEKETALSPNDERLIRDFLEKLLKKSKNVLESNKDLREIRAFYLLCQVNANTKKILEAGVSAYPAPQPATPAYQPPQYRLSSNNLTARDYFLEGSRERELSALSKALETEQEVFIWGLGGMGKSMLALKLVERLGREAYRLQYQDSMENTLLKLTFADGTNEYRYQPRSGLTPEEQKRAELQERLTMLKESHGDALFIVDNFDAEDRNVNALLAEEACQNLRDLGVKLIYTTRCPCGEKWEKLRPLSGDDLLKVMGNITQDAFPPERLRPLIEVVHGHTLMVVLMARTLREGYGGVTPETILAALNKHDLSEADFPKVHSHKDRNFLEAQLYEHMKALFDLTNVTEPARNVLRCAALLPDGGMDGDLFQNCVVPPRKPLLKRLLDRLSWRKKPDLPEERDWVNKLVKTGWLARSGDLLTIHPVIREVCLKELKPDMATCGPFLGKLWAQYDKTNYNAVRYRQMADCFACAARILTEDKTGEWALSAGVLYYQLGDYRAALKQNLAVVALREDALPSNRPDLTTAYNNVGGTYGALGNHNKALEYQKRALDIRERVLPPNHPALATSYNNVGVTYGDLGDHNKALEYKKKALEIQKRIAPDHPNLAASYNNVGLTYGALGDYGKALEYQKKALKIRERILAPGHPDLAASYNNVGGTYLELGKQEKEQGNEEKASEHLEKALEYMKEALKIQEKKLPPYHPYMRFCRENIAVVYLEMGDEEQAAHWRALAEATPAPPDDPPPTP